METPVPACSFLKKKTLAQAFFCEFSEICRKTIFTEHLWTTASANSTGVFRTQLNIQVGAFCMIPDSEIYQIRRNKSKTLISKIESLVQKQAFSRQLFLQNVQS